MTARAHRPPDAPPASHAEPQTQPQPQQQPWAPRPWGVVAGLLVVALLGALHLPFPFSGDKALYQFGARALAESGGVLYQDFWDLKKPGVYLFHTIAGRLFGFTEVGLHLFELLYLLAFSLVLVRAVRPHLVHPALAAAAPVVTVGAYYCITSGWHLTQPAVIALFPLFLAIWPSFATWRGERERMTGYLLAGVAGACAALVKPETLPVVLGSWLLATVIAHRGGAPLGRSAATRFGPGLAGLAAVILAVVAWFAARGALAEMLSTTVLHPMKAWELGEGRNLARLASSITWFVTTFAAPLALLLLVPGTWRGIGRERFVLEMALWLVTGSLAILAEPYAWWQFDFMLLVVPVGLLGLRGADGLVSALRGRGVSRRASRTVAVSLLLAAFLPGFLQWTAKARTLVATLREAEGDWVRVYQEGQSAHYAHARNEMSFLHAPEAIPGPIYVFGNPIYQLYSGRPQAIAANGWAWVAMPKHRWPAHARELQRVRPAYVYVDRGYREHLQGSAPELLDWLARSYEVQLRDDRGTWYARRGPRPGADTDA